MLGLLSFSEYSKEVVDMQRYPDVSRLLALAALIIFSVVAFVAFQGNPPFSVEGGALLGLAFLAAASVV